MSKLRKAHLSPLFLAVIMMLALVLSGCGGNDDPTTVVGVPSTSTATSTIAPPPSTVTTGTPSTSTAVSSIPSTSVTTSTPSTSTPAVTPGGAITVNADGTRTVTHPLTKADFVVPEESFAIASTAPASTTGIIVAGAVDKLVALDESIGNNPWILDKFPQLADLPVVFAGNATNLEALLQTEPDLVFWAPRYGTETENQLKDIDSITVVNSSTTSAGGLATDEYTPMDSVYYGQWFYGAVIGGESGQLAQQFVEYFDERKAEIDSVLAGLADEDRPRVVDIRAMDPLTTISKLGIGQNWMHIGGGVNASGDAPGLSGTSGAIEVTMEQMLAWNPEVIICDNPTYKDDIMADPAWANIDAVINGRVHIMPSGSMTWGYNGPEEALMIQWAATVIHPDKFAHFDMRQIAKDFYQTFMGLELDETDIDQLFTRDFSSTPTTPPAGNPGNVTNSDGTRTVTYPISGAEFTVPEESFRIASTAPAYTTGIIVAGAVDKLVALDESIGNNPWIIDKFPQLADLPVVFAGNATNLEALLQTEPDLVFWASRYGTETEAQLKEIDGITIVNNSIPGPDGAGLDAPTPMDNVYHGQWFYGAIIGGESGQLAQQFVEYFDAAREEIGAILDDITEEERPRVIDIRAMDPLTTISNEGIGTNWSYIAGGINASADAPGLSGTSGAIEVTMEQMLAWNPEVIICDNPTYKDDILADPAWANIDAVINGRVHVMPSGSMSWGYNGPEEALMIQWAATVIHPDKFAHFDMRQRAKDFYQTFMGLELDETDIDQIFTRDFS